MNVIKFAYVVKHNMKNKYTRVGIGLIKFRVYITQHLLILSPPDVLQFVKNNFESQNDIVYGQSFRTPSFMEQS